MKWLTSILFLFLLSCSSPDWELENCEDCQVSLSTKTYNSPNGDYSIDIPIDWEPYFSSYSDLDSSNVSFNINLESPKLDSNDIMMISIYRNNFGNYSSPKEELENGMKVLKRDFPELQFIEWGETEILGFKSYYLHSREKERIDKIGLTFQVKNEVDSNYYILEVLILANGKEKENICLMLEILKSFTFNSFF